MCFVLLEDQASASASENPASLHCGHPAQPVVVIHTAGVKSLQRGLGVGQYASALGIAVRRRGWRRPLQRYSVRVDPSVGVVGYVSTMSAIFDAAVLAAAAGFVTLDEDAGITFDGLGECLPTGMVVGSPSHRGVL